MKNHTVLALSLFSLSLNAMEKSSNSSESLYLNLSGYEPSSGIYGRNTGFNFPKTGSKKVTDLVNKPGDVDGIMNKNIKPISRKERILIEQAIEKHQKNVHVKDKQMNDVFNAVALQFPIVEDANKTIKKPEEISYFRYFIGAAVGATLAAANPALAEKVAEVAFKSAAASVYGGFVSENLVPGRTSVEDLNKFISRNKDELAVVMSQECNTDQAAAIKRLAEQAIAIEKVTGEMVDIGRLSEQMTDIVTHPENVANILRLSEVENYMGPVKFSQHKVMNECYQSLIDAENSGVTGNELNTLKNNFSEAFFNFHDDGSSK